ncbi:hypothetical protein [Flectobacillus major]|uniref:hypothetical protein n=1 Tax=Flectobacillus major TaxID=103 RepID=UPI00041CE7AA|nr:hypothetical protein [Flectobacillus major]
MNKKQLFGLAIFSQIIFSLYSFKAQAQAVSYYPWSNILSVSSNPTKRLWVDCRFQLNSFSSSLNTEPALMLNVLKAEKADFYLGGGVNFGFVGAIVNETDLVKGYFGSMGTRIYPLEKTPQLSVNFEISPYINNAEGTSGIIRAWFGVGYHFGGRKK